MVQVIIRSCGAAFAKLNTHKNAQVFESDNLWQVHCLVIQQANLGSLNTYSLLCYFSSK